jgi:hypothetical protein
MTGWIYPSWVTGDTLLRSWSGAILTDDAVFTQVGPGKADDELDRWFYEEGGMGVADVELSRDTSLLVGTGNDDTELRVYRTTMSPFGAPDWNHQPFHKGNVPVAERCARFTGAAGGKFEGPSLSPDGRGMAVGDAEGIHVIAVPDLSGGCGDPGAPRLLLPGGRHADWGPAGIPPASAYGNGPQPPAKPALSPDPKGGGAGAGARATLSVKAPRLRRALAKGLVVRVTGARAGRVRLVARRGRATVARGTAVADRAGRATVRLRFGAKARRTLRKARRVTLSISGAGVSKRVALRR